MTYPWFKMQNTIVHDPRVRRLTPAERWCWVGLQALASASPQRGSLYVYPGSPYTVEEAADAVGVPAELMAHTVGKCAAMGLLEFEATPEGAAIAICGWDEEQYSPGYRRTRRWREAQGACSGDGPAGKARGGSTGAAAGRTSGTEDGLGWGEGAPDGDDDHAYDDGDGAIYDDRAADGDEDVYEDDAPADAGDDAHGDAYDDGDDDGHDDAMMTGDNRRKIDGRIDRSIHQSINPSISSSRSRAPQGNGQGPPCENPSEEGRADRTGAPPGRWVSTPGRLSPPALSPRLPCAGAPGEAGDDGETGPSPGPARARAGPCPDPPGQGGSVPGWRYRDPPADAEEVAGAAGSDDAAGEADEADAAHGQVDADGFDGQTYDPDEADADNDGPDDGAEADEEEADDTGEGEILSSWEIESTVRSHARQWAPARDPDGYVDLVLDVWAQTDLHEESMRRAVSKAIQVTRGRIERGLLHSTGYMEYMLAVLRNEVLAQPGGGWRRATAGGGGRG